MKVYMASYIQNMKVYMASYRVDPGNFVQMGIFVQIYLVLCCHGKNNVNPNTKMQSFSWKPILLENPFPQHQTSMSCLQ